MTQCRYCQAPMRFVATEAGKSMPLDPDPHPRGNVLLVNRAGVQVARVLGPLERIEQARVHDLYMPHWSTCPGADQARKAGAR